jgi:hypothetical protein
MLPVPVGGAFENVKVLPDTLYVLGSCSTPLTATKTEEVPAGATDIVYTVVDPVPLKVSVTNAIWLGDCPIYGMAYS